MTEDISTLYADSVGQTAEMHPVEIIPEAQHFECVDHPGEGFVIGVGYAGGGFGSYKRCRVCRRVYSKLPLKDGNDGMAA